MRLIVTRPKEDAAGLASRLEGFGHQVLLAPLLRIVARGDAAIPERDYQAVAITSANGARALHRHPQRRQVVRYPALTLGPQSLAAACAAGFADATAAGGDVAGLARHIVETRAPGEGPILYLSGAETAGDLQGLLMDRGFAVERCVLYDAVPAGTLSVDPGDADGVLLFSPRTARIWARLAGDRAASLVHVCLSRNVALALPAGWTARVAATPDEAALLALLDRP